jgi:SAM-dependent methyltransferase
MNEVSTDRPLETDGASVAQSAARRCPGCGTAAQGDALERSHEAGLYACSNCDLQFWYPAIMPGADWYEAAYRGRVSTEMPLEPGHLYFLSDPRAPKRGSLLDMGCGSGNFLAAARDAGFEVTGFEPDQNAVQFSKEHYGLKNVYASLPGDFRREHPGERFDVVTFFEVLEHQKDPQSFLDIAKSFVTDGGYIALSVPNGTRWQVGVDTLDYPPNHLTRWSPRALRSFLERNGLEVISIRQQPLTVRRAAQMLSALLATGMVSRVAGEKPVAIADLANMTGAEVHERMDRLANNSRHSLATRLAGWKSRILMPLAFVLLPLFRLRGYTGLYLYCLVRRRSSHLRSDSAVTKNTNSAVRI